VYCQIKDDRYPWLQPRMLVGIHAFLIFHMNLILTTEVLPLSWV
jgi:hypothetical protein